MTKDEFFQDRRFFFDTAEIKETAEYALRYSPEEASKVLKTADEAAAQRYMFTLRWDLEQTSVPVVFNDEIDWLRQPGDDAEFVYAFNRMRHWICYGEAYAMTGDEKYYDAFIRTWDFDNRYFMNHSVGESRQLLAEDGTPIVAAMGNPWKGIYHTGRAFAECIERLDECMAKEG